LIDNIKKTGSKIFSGFLRVVAVVCIYLIGAMTGPSWDLRKLVENVAHNPAWTTPIIWLIAVVVLFLVAIFIGKIIFKKE
jgi:putative copper export protein